MFCWHAFKLWDWEKEVKHSQEREIMRLKHYSIRTERCYCNWIRRYVKFHQMQQRQDLCEGDAKIELFLSDLAVNGHVAASTQNQAFNALLLLYRQVLHQTLNNIQACSAGSLSFFLSKIRAIRAIRG